MKNDNPSQRRTAPKPTPKAWSLWLLPDPETQDFLCRVMSKVQPLFDQPAFAPHVTVQGDQTRGPGDLVSIAKTLAEHNGTIAFGSATLAGSAFFYRALFVQFPTTQAFTTIMTQASNLLGNQTGLPPFAHASLAYGQIKTEPNYNKNQQTLVHILSDCLPDLATRTFYFDHLAVVLSAKSVPIPNWKEYARVALGGKL